MNVRFILGPAAAFGLAAALSVAPAAAQTPPPASQGVTQASANNTVSNIVIDPDQALSADNAFQNATGNIGFNAAAGNGNQQANVTYLDTGSPPYTVSSSLAQVSAANTVVSIADSHQAAFEDNSFQNASGNIGANAAAGNLNQQINAAIVADANDFAGTTLAVGQAAAGDQYGTADNLNTAGNATLTSTSSNAFQNASGNIGVNVAAGNGNQQANQLVLGSASKESGSGPSTAPLAQSVAQVSAGNLVLSADINVAGAAFNGFQNASGNIGYNATAGNGNQQVNSTFIDDQTSSAFAFTGSYAQVAAGNTVMSANLVNAAGFINNAFQNASGNIGANAASGNFNAQLNAAVVLTGTELASSTSSLAQVSAGGSYTTSDTNVAAVAGNAFQNASGNIGVNVATGNGNMQANTLLISH